MARFFRRKKEAPSDPTQIAPAPEPSEAVEHVPSAEIRTGVERSRRAWFGRIGGLFQRGLSDETWDELEETLIAADTGVQTTLKILNDLKARTKRDGLREPQQAMQALKEELQAILNVPSRGGQLWGVNGDNPNPPRPAVILVVGVNGTGKTTSIGKLANIYRSEGMNVILAAADTFRAAAIDQLKHWGQRVAVDVIAHQQGADPGAVVFDAMAAAEARQADVVLIDTAGRLHTKANLMAELSKIHQIIKRKDPSAPHEVLLVLDATIGQNALPQAKYFTEAVGVTGIVLAKLDGTAKGGVIFAICDQFGIPVRFVGTGEKPDDLALFDSQEFVEALVA